MKSVCVYCGSSPGLDPRYLDIARQLGLAMVSRQCELVYGGASVGLMGELANSILNAGGIVRGVIPRPFAHRVSHEGLTELRVVGSMHERKTMMFELADAFIALPGGMGTLEEIAEVLTWAQLAMHTKPCGLINVNGYYDHLLAFLDNAVASGFMRPEHRSLLLVSTDPEDLLERLASYEPKNVDKLTGESIRM
jgi:uncharacterized protein (TIGR00730 family)